LQAAIAVNARFRARLQSAGIAANGIVDAGVAWREG
jgi:hypothetical protein